MRSMIFLSILTLPLWAQPDLTRADVYMPGDTANFLVVDGTGVDPGPAGNGVTWDFSNLPRIPAEDYTVRYDSPSAAPNAGLFPTANMVAIQNAGPIDAYTFFTVSDQQFFLEGLDLPDLGVVTYSNNNLWITFPLGYNETQTDDFVGTYTFNANGISGIADRTGELSTKYDGWGTLILPDGTSVPNVRRLKMEQTINDVISVSGFAITTTVVTTTYNFFAENDTNHLFHITYGETTVSTTGITVNSVEAAYRGFDGTQNPQVATRRGAHLTSQSGGFASEILIRNPEDTQQTLSLQPYDGNGGALDPESVSINAGATVRVLQNDLFPTSAQSFSSSGCETCIFSVGYRAQIDNPSTAQVHQTQRYSDEFYFYPGEWAELFDGAALINSGDAAAKIEATQLDSNGNEIKKVTLIGDLEPGGKHLAIFNDLFDDLPNTVIQLESSQEMAVMILRISKDGRFLYQNLPLPEMPAANQQRMIAHITSETGGFDTDLIFHNTSGSSKTVTLHPFDRDGMDLPPVNITVPGNATHRFAKTEKLDGAASHMTITGDLELLVSVGYRARVENASTAVIHEAAPLENTFYLYPGEWDVLFDGVALVNAGSSAATITLTQIGDDGVARQSVVLTDNLAPGAKFLNLLEGLIPEDRNTIIKVESTQPVSVLTLRLSKDNRYLYGNNPLPQ